MKVFVLGGYGKVGLPASKLLAQADMVTKIAVAGRSLERAEKAATEIGEKGVAVHADGTDEQLLTSLLAGYDLIMNAATPKAELPAIRAAIRTGTHYCHVDLDEKAMGLSSEAKAAGITAIVASGISPSITNLMGVHVARQMEQVEQLQVGRADMYNFQSGRGLTPRQWLEDPRESVVALREFRPFIAWLLQILQKNGVRTVLDCQRGQWVEVHPIKRGLDVPAAQGGTTKSYPFFSGDDYWGQLPGNLSTISPVLIVFSPLPPQLHDLLRDQALRVLEGDIDFDAATNSFYGAVESDPYRWLTVRDDFVLIPQIWVRAVGRKEDRPARHTCWFTPAMWNVGGYFLTSVALAVAVLRILRGEVQERGVMHAETAFDPLSFLDEVAAVLPEPLPDGRVVDESFEWLE